MKRPAALATLVGGLLLSVVAHAHQDRFLFVTPSGNIRGLPPEYMPAKLLVEFSRQSEDPAPVSSVVVVLAGAKTVLPECFTTQLPSRRRSDVVLGGSWYHDESIVPYYLWVDFFEPSDNERWAHPAPFRVLFNLRTGDVLEVSPRRLASCVTEQREH